MIKKNMSRILAREIAMQIIFEISFNNNIEEILEFRLNNIKEIDNQKKYIINIVNGIIMNESNIYQYIKKYSLNWNIDRISKISLSILKISIYEILYLKKEIPVSSSINEAIKLAKKYESVKSASFINGILGSVAKNLEN